MRMMKRALLNHVLSRVPEKPLYHYTTQRGLLGIIRSKGMWVTHTQYLNDRREFVHAVDLVLKEINALREMPSQALEAENLSKIEEALRGKPEGINVCVCSFSENRDSLSQWRAYGSRTSGFAIGFPGPFLTAVTERMEWYLAPCVYDPEKQRQIIHNLVAEVLEEARTGDWGFTAEEKDQQQIWHRGLAGTFWLI